MPLAESPDVAPATLPNRQSEAGLAQAFVANHTALVRYVARRVKCLFTARDLVQEVYLRTLRVDAGTVGNARAMLFEIAANLATDHARAEGRRARLLEESQELLWGPAQEQSAEQQTCTADELERIGAALDRLPPRSQVIFHLNRFEGLTQKEIARQLGISRTSVEKHMRRALRRLSEASSDGEA